MSGERFRLMQDLDGDWYLVQADKRLEFLEWTLSEDWDPAHPPRNVCRKLPAGTNLHDITFEKVTY